VVFNNKCANLPQLEKFHKGLFVFPAGNRDWPGGKAGLRMAGLKAGHR